MKPFIALTAAAAAAAILAAPNSSLAGKHYPNLTPTQLRAYVYRTDPCLAHIIDHEDGRWDPTINYSGGHGDVNESYGLGQANPGTKMAAYGRDWRTNPWTQLRWARAYARKFGGTCGAWSWWQGHGSW